MLPTQLQTDCASGPRWFATTHWSVVLNAAEHSSPQAESALDNLCRSYWYPLYAYVRRRGYGPDDAAELTQEFFAQLLAKKLLHGVDPTKGRFRSWLLGVMKHFLAHEWVRARAQKRGGGQPLFSLDEIEAEQRYHLEPIDQSTPENSFDRQWAYTVLERAAANLRSEYESSGKLALHNVLKGHLSPEDAAQSYEATAARLGLTVGAVKSAIHRLRQRYHQLIREEIAQTVTTSSEVDEEIRYLLEVIRHS